MTEIHPFITTWYHFCPNCKSGLGQEKLSSRCQNCGYAFYLNPAPCTTVIIEKDGQILLGKRAAEPMKGWWDLLGGFISVGETVEAGAIREIKEETGLTVSSLIQLGSAVPDVYADTHIPTLNFIFLVPADTMDVAAHDDVAELRWFTVDEIPRDQLAFKNDYIALDRYQQYRKEHHDT